MRHCSVSKTSRLNQWSGHFLLYGVTIVSKALQPGLAGGIYFRESELKLVDDLRNQIIHGGMLPLVPLYISE